MNNYGFVYVWKDKKHNKYYIGCHWGKEDDGYICSSVNMNRAYKRRSQDFKRRILGKIYTNRTDLLEEEYKWLQLIKDEELEKRYYNLHNYHFNHWSASSNKEKQLSIKEKIKISNTNRICSRETREKMTLARHKYLINIKLNNIEIKNEC